MTGRRALGTLVGLVARVWFATLRLSVEVAPDVASALGQRPIVLAFWHGQQMALLKWAMRERIVALVSRSRDGELQAGALPVLGLRVARGSSSRGGAEGLRAIVRSLARGFAAAFALDGPRGPGRVVRRAGDGRVGAVVAASLARGSIAPMAAACSGAWIVSGSWDAFEIPKPFSRVAVVVGPALAPEDATPDALRGALEDACLRAADRLARPRRAFAAPAMSD